MIDKLFNLVPLINKGENSKKVKKENKKGGSDRKSFYLIVKGILENF